VHDPAVARAAGALMGSERVQLFHDHVLVKEPGTSMATPWHSDGPYYFVAGRQTVSFWVPLDPVPRDRSIEFVAGSHRAGKLYRAERFNGQSLYEGDESERVPDVDAARGDLDIRGWEAAPGDAVAFAFRCLHGAPANQSAERRRVISVRWVGDDARFAVRPGRTSPPFPDLVYRDGDPFDAPDFPVLWRA